LLFKIEKGSEHGVLQDEYSCPAEFSFAPAAMLQCHGERNDGRNDKEENQEEEMRSHQRLSFVEWNSWRTMVL
jgi:hypothetical protein